MNDDELDDAKIREIIIRTREILREQNDQGIRFNVTVDKIVKALKEVVSEDDN